MATDNGKIFDEGMRKAREVINDYLYNIMRNNGIGNRRAYAVY